MKFYQRNLIGACFLFGLLIHLLFFLTEKIYREEAKNTSHLERFNHEKICKPLDGGIHFENPINRRDYMREICSRCYGENPIRDLRQNCRRYSGNGIILLTDKLFLTVPNKCASTLMYDWAHEILNFDELLKDPMYTNLYSERAEVVAYAKKYSQKFCEKREGDILTRVLFVRHPLLRLISAWNDKFNINNLDNMNGAVFGTKHFIARSNYFAPEWRTIQELFIKSSKEKCLRIMQNPSVDDQSLKECLKGISVHERFEVNPYLVSFERLVNYLLFMQQQRQKYKINDHFTPIDQSEISGFENRDLSSGYERR